MSAEQDIEAGQRMKALLADPVFAAAVEKVRQKHYQEFTTAKTHGASVGAWGKGQALNDLLQELQAVVGNGDRASIEAKRQAERRQR
jgi:hypothetical protein